MHGPSKNRKVKTRPDILPHGRGFVWIRDAVKKRRHGKAFGVIFNCLVTRAVHLVVLAERYSTKEF